MKYFATALKLKNSLISDKVRVHRNHFGELGVFTTNPIKRNEIVFADFGKILCKKEVVSLSTITRSSSTG